MNEIVLASPVEIRVPPVPTMSRVLRLAASGVASLAGFTVDEIEDIKIAVSEVLIALIEHGEGNSIDVQFAVKPDGFDINGRTAADHFDANDPDLALCRTVLGGVSADHRIDHIHGEIHIWASVDRESIQ